MRVTTTPTGALLDTPQPGRQLSVPFAERLEPGDDRVMTLVRNLNARIESGPMMRSEWDERFLHTGLSLIWEHQNAAAAVAKLPATRAATRNELYRRLLRGRDFLLSSLDARVASKKPPAKLASPHIIFTAPSARFSARRRTGSSCGSGSDARPPCCGTET